jgi:type II secretory pathway pseudopilin PulG
MSIDIAKMAEITIVGAVLVLLVTSLIIPIARWLMMRIDERIATIAEVQRDIRSEQQRCRKVTLPPPHKRRPVKAALLLE